MLVGIALCILAAIAAAMPTLRALAAAPELQVEELAPGNFVHYGDLGERSRENLGDQANIGFVVGSRCVAVIDTGGTLEIGRRLLGAIRQRTALPVCYVILTHVHPDHILGAAAFLQEQPVFVGHRNLPRAMEQRGRFYLKALQRDLGDLAAGSELVMPTLVVEDERRLDLGGRVIALKAWPTAHTDNDLTILDEQTGTLWASDLLFVQHTPVIDGSIVGFLSVLERLAQIPAAHVVPGHGLSRLPWPQALETEKRYLQVVLNETRAQLKARKTIQEAVDSVGVSERTNWVNFESFHRRNVTAAYSELEWED
jgi:quinoprotein relay system zinc metallohydrolase 2